MLHPREGPPEEKRDKVDREGIPQGGVERGCLGISQQPQNQREKAITSEKVRAEDPLWRPTQGNRMLASWWLEWALRPWSPPDPE